VTRPTPLSSSRPLSSRLQVGFVKAPSSGRGEWNNVRLGPLYGQGYNGPNPEARKNMITTALTKDTFEETVAFADGVSRVRAALTS